MKISSKMVAKVKRLPQRVSPDFLKVRYIIHLFIFDLSIILIKIEFIHELSQCLELASDEKYSSSSLVLQNGIIYNV